MAPHGSLIPPSIEDASEEAVAALLAQPPQIQSPDWGTLSSLPGGNLEGAAMREGMAVMHVAATDTLHLLVEWRSFLSATLADKTGDVCGDTPTGRAEKIGPTTEAAGPIPKAR